MEKKTVLFDLDGTLTDSGEGIINCAMPALNHFGITADRQDMRVFVGPPLRETFRKFGIAEADTEEAIRIYRSRYLTVGMFENAPYQGIRELLQRLRAQGHRLCVATSKPESMAVAILEKFELAEFFDLICGATMDDSRDSKDKVIAYLLEKMDSSQEVVMVGDTHYDVTGAAAHGIPTIGVSWGYGNADDMIAAGAAAIVDTPEELYKQLQSPVSLL